MRPILLLEINEVPLRVYRKYASDPRFPNIARLVNESAMIETINTESGELSPWCTWPTFHRGLSKKDHGVYHLGQDPSTFHGTPIWDEYLNRGFSVGIFGSMQSWPPHDPGVGGFYVPDTFSSNPACIPQWLEPVQEFNLGLVRENGRVMGDGLLRRAMKPALWLSLLKAKVSFLTGMRALWQILVEKWSPAFRERRVSFQGILFWDIFRGLYKPENPPAFTTFFTNHVASVMHRFWNHVFPEDFEKPPEGRPHLATMDFAMGVLDGMFGEALSWRDKNPKILLLVANSMGQGTKIRHGHQGIEILLKDIPKALAALGVPSGVQQNLAMVPQVALDLKDVITYEKFEELLLGMVTKKGSRILLSDHRNATVSITVVTPWAEEIEDNKILVHGKEMSLEDAGFEKIKIDAGTAYHIPDGLIFAHGLSGVAVPKESPVAAEKVKGIILGWADL